MIWEPPYESPSALVGITRLMRIVSLFRLLDVLWMVKPYSLSQAHLSEHFDPTK